MEATGCGAGVPAADGAAGGAGVAGLGALGNGLPNKLFGAGGAGVADDPFRLNEPRLKPVHAGVGVGCGGGVVP